MEILIDDLIKHLDSLEVIEQKTEEWLNARKLLISASEAGYLLGIKGIQVLLDYILSKVDAKSMGHISKLEPTLHGTIYEDISRTIYSLRNKLIVKEYGLIKTKKNPILGASPDGIVIDILPGGNKDRIGRLVEIKNPFTFDNTNKIKDEYKIQILQQQYVLGIPKCDFLKTNIISSFAISKTNKEMSIKPYNNLKDMLNDTYKNDSGKVINNPNIPITNLTSDGNEKGVIIRYLDKTNDKVIVEMYPLDIQYEESLINKWIEDTEVKLIESGCDINFIKTGYWYLINYSEQLVKYDKTLFEKYYIPRLELIWKIIDNIKNVKNKYDNEFIKQYLNCNLYNALSILTNNRQNKFKNIENHEEICYILNECIDNINELKTNNIQLENFKFETSLKKTRRKNINDYGMIYNTDDNDTNDGNDNTECNYIIDF